MNNLFGCWAMSEYRPYKGFKWLKNIEKFDIMSRSEKSPTGYFCEVDLEYPDELLNYIMIFHYLKNVLFLMIRCQSIVKKS